MKKFNFKLKDLKFRRVDVHELDDRMLLVNLYMTQGLVLLIAAVIMLFQKPSLGSLFSIDNPGTILIWGGSFALIVLAADLLISRWVPPEVTDDGGINKMIFGNRALWHIALLSLIVSICEEVLFRGAIQAAWGPYWTSILFAAIHIRYLQHWLMTGLVFSISYGLGWIYIQTGSLWTPIFAHFLIDFVMGCILRYRREE
ncbi:CPBP family intramembrane glutamic endopeptidase [Paenibacillus mucilaginosus]|uniref:Abortive infection protein n=2 Tax=Paenibacillus mucilaginosus TaxID=61624 RepID=I0BI46_9BACL|nr:CPBP family intramembrane glutamic endopeptidase [Paenibacillus mucilaginosus]AEI41308.1 Abortive infection protein [Paenibacillus mucilaginosus KNP414]AFH62043.1 abortive infection protein [Paenibacillus mucilaginosus K02]MCG7211271.1 CPBP family intramembrane metalloprotease [Paenibacillus mucilaginosus]WDM30338.1 CPBP family intramembrane metalloprotease [Paenibacillus mucilaginosus]